MSDESDPSSEEPRSPRSGSLFGDMAILSVALGVNYLLLSPFFMVHRTAGASTTDYLDRRGKPLLLELRHCRVVPATDGQSPRRARDGAPGAGVTPVPAPTNKTPCPPTPAPAADPGDNPADRS